MNLRWAAYAAYANSVTQLVQLMSSGGDPKANGAIGLVNNAAGVLWALTFILLAYFFYRASREHANIVSAAVFAFGIVGAAAAVFIEVATATGRITFEQETVSYYPVLGAIGVWMLMAEGIAIMETELPRRPLVFGAVIGGLWFFANVLFGVGGLPSPTIEGPTNDATDSGILLLEMAFLLQPFWGLWLGRSLLGPPAARTPEAR
ncbi:MAG: hypothetical protein M3O64_02725 [Chloroflexota bacterium]|nr:hypothetical protein [Chloroflexota bacterium]